MLQDVAVHQHSQQRQNLVPSLLRAAANVGLSLFFDAMGRLGIFRAWGVDEAGQMCHSPDVLLLCRSQGTCC